VVDGNCFSVSGQSLGKKCFLSMFTYVQSAAKSSCLQMKKPDSAYYYMLKGHHARTPDLVGKMKKLDASPMHAGKTNSR
jgi:hypothetical protein